MTAVLLSRAAWISACLDALHKTNSSFDRELIAAGLPTTFEDDSCEYVSILRMADFLSKVDRRTAAASIYFSVSEDATHRSLSLEYSRRAPLTPKLIDRLSLFSKCLPIEWNCAHSWVTTSGATARVYSRFSSAVPIEALQYLEWLQHVIVRSIIREFAGSGWNPDTIAFRSNFTAQQASFWHHPNTRLLVGQKVAYMDFPASLLNLHVAGNQWARAVDVTDVLTVRTPAELKHDFIGSLKLALRAYLPDYYPSLDIAAAIAGVGARTLQRRLGQFGLTYSELIGHVRLESAIRLLHDPERKIIDIAYKVGYNDPSHFTRAFRRAMGASPRVFRQRLMTEAKVRSSPGMVHCAGDHHALSRPRSIHAPDHIQI